MRKRKREMGDGKRRFIYDCREIINEDMFRYVGYHVNFHFGFLVGWVVTAGERNKGLQKPLVLERFSEKSFIPSTSSFSFCSEAYIVLLW